jgi:hypothetical protein
MSDLSELRLTEIQEQCPGVPRDILAPAIDSAGIVDTTQLGHIIRAFQAGVEGRVVAKDAQNAAQLKTLQAAYDAAQARHDGPAMVTLKSRIFALEHGKG